jgi:hypothetical protein
MQALADGELLTGPEYRRMMLCLTSSWQADRIDGVQSSEQQKQRILPARPDLNRATGCRSHALRI